MTPKRKSKLDRVLNCRQPDLTVLLENIEDPRNVSAVLRSCDAVGIQSVYILNTELPQYRKFKHRSAASASGWLSIHQFDNVEQCVAAMRTHIDRIYATHLTEEASSLYDLDLTKPVALAFGNEKRGISAELLSHCDGNIIIPQVGMIRSLNISVACAVSIYEAFRQRNAAGYYSGEPRLQQDEMADLKKAWKYRE